MTDWLVSFDYETPMMQVFHMARGCKGLIVTPDELRQLEKRGIRCHAPMLDPATGEYLIQLSKKDYKLACKTLGL